MVIISLPAILAGLLVVNALQYKGVDWSSVIVEEKAGVSYKNANGNVQPLEKILADNGVNTVRQRVWVTPQGGSYNLDYNIKLGQRAKAVGMGVYLDLHFSDTWADPAHQTIPSGWPSDIDTLSWRLYNYTLEVSNKFQDAGVQPTIISIGNEITPGFLWPTGRTNNWSNIARLLHSASAGIKASRLQQQPKIMIHLDNGWNWATQNNWYTNVLKQGTLLASDYDMMGVSFYPFYSASATLSSLKLSLVNMANAWGKEVLVVETDWPVSCPSPKQQFPSDAKNIPYTAAGQSTWMQKVAEVVSSVKGGTGLFYWEPAWIHNANLGSSCADNCMFSQAGQALSSMSVFKTI
ncbi:Arabinogalactan endo-1,4-beta-galactosidase [Lasiosphaeris hirsuta]|uniref:Arabinogalactan endo-beta-1,4-galactanase n=1 Tax=Lasiosphaeris hirsuta TaxID=260670 RepID=A0AA40BAR6_9PEZI|nr:Arabinogalactan endo-1,4-beta-galactosidase [Lasiosphaeris hirsuta]